MRRGRRANALSLQATMPPFLPGLVDRRFLWGGFGLFTSLDTDIAALLSGPDAGRWRDAIGDALSSTHRRAPREMQRLEDEPDLKRGPGGLRDLRRAIWANTPASARPMSLTQAPLIEAHRFLWLGGVICIFSRVAQTTVLACHSNPATRYKPPLRLTCWNLFRYHARNVLAAIRVTPPAKSGIQT